MKEQSKFVYELGTKTITVIKNTTGGVEIKYEDDNGNLAYFTPNEALSLMAMLHSVLKKHDLDMPDTMTENGWVNVEKNGKKGGIIL